MSRGSVRWSASNSTWNAAMRERRRDWAREGGLGIAVTSAVRLGHDEAAIDVDDLPRDVGGGIRREEGDDRTNLVRFGVTAHGDTAADHFLLLVREPGRHVRLDEAGRDAVHRDPARRDLEGKRAREADDAGLGGRSEEHT